MFKLKTNVQMIDKSSIEVLNGNFAKPMLGEDAFTVLSLFDGMSLFYLIVSIKVIIFA